MTRVVKFIYNVNIYDNFDKSYYTYMYNIIKKNVRFLETYEVFCTYDRFQKIVFGLQWVE